MRVTPHVAQNTSGRRSAIDRRTTRHDGYPVSLRARKRIKETLGWIKGIAGQEKTRFRGLLRVGWAFTYAAAAYDLVRLSKLLGADVTRHRTSALKGKRRIVEMSAWPADHVDLVEPAYIAFAP